VTKKQFFKLGSVAQLAKLTGKSPSTIYRWRRQGVPKSINLDVYTPKIVPLTSREKKQQKEQRRLAKEFAEYVKEKERVAGLRREKAKAKRPPPKEAQKKRIKEIKQSEVKLAILEERREKRRLIRESRRKEEQEWSKEAPLRKITPGRSKANVRALGIQKQLLKKTRNKREKQLIQFKIEVLENWIEQSRKEGPFRYYYFDDRDVVDYADLEDISIHEAYDELYGY